MTNNSALNTQAVLRDIGAHDFFEEVQLLDTINGLIKWLFKDSTKQLTDTTTMKEVLTIQLESRVVLFSVLACEILNPNQKYQSKFMTKQN